MEGIRVDLDWTTRDSDEVLSAQCMALCFRMQEFGVTLFDCHHVPTPDVVVRCFDKLGILPCHVFMKRLEDSSIEAN